MHKKNNHFSKFFLFLTLILFGIFISSLIFSIKNNTSTKQFIRDEIESLSNSNYNVSKKSDNTDSQIILASNQFKGLDVEYDIKNNTLSLKFNTLKNLDINNFSELHNMLFNYDSKNTITLKLLNSSIDEALKSHSSIYKFKDFRGKPQDIKINEDSMTLYLNLDS